MKGNQSSYKEDLKVCYNTMYKQLFFTSPSTWTG
jgi:hypothetical protein